MTDDRATCRVCTDRPAVTDEGRCERCHRDDLRLCADPECGAITDRRYCRTCQAERDECAREDAAEVERET